MSKVHHLKANNLESHSTVSTPNLAITKINELIDESQEQIKECYIEDIKGFFEKNIEDLTGLDIPAASDYIASHLPENLYEYMSFVIDILSRALL
jgi:hypothetical protein